MGPPLGRAPAARSFRPHPPFTQFALAALPRPGSAVAAFSTFDRNYLHLRLIFN